MLFYLCVYCKSLKMLFVHLSFAYVDEIENEYKVF
jgi:hypothetical protein